MNLYTPRMTSNSSYGIFKSSTLRLPRMCVIVILTIFTFAPLSISLFPVSGNSPSLSSVKVSLVYADTPDDTGTTGGVDNTTSDLGKNPRKADFPNPLKTEYNSIEKLLTGLVKLAVRVGTLVAIFFFIFAGFRYVTAMGDETKLKAAQKSLTNTAIGTAILVSATVIVTLIQNTLNSIQK